jgi:hypothetical protein
MLSLSSTFSTKVRQLDFEFDGDLEGNCDCLLSVLSDFETEKLEDVDNIRLSIGLYNYPSWLLYRYGRSCCARILCHGAIHYNGSKNLDKERIVTKV